MSERNKSRNGAKVLVRQPFPVDSPTQILYAVWNRVRREFVYPYDPRIEPVLDHLNQMELDV